MNYTVQNALGIQILKHQISISNLDLQTLNTNPVLLTNFLPAKGIVVLGMCIRGQVIANAPNIPFYIGDIDLLRNNTRNCWSEFGLRDVQAFDTFNIHIQQNPKTNNDTHWNVKGASPYFQNLEIYLYQTADSPTFNITGISFSIYYIDDFNA